MSKEALIVKRDVLFNKLNPFHGFLPKEYHDFIQTILQNYEYHPRGDDLENNSDLQQIIPYVWIINPETKQVFAYLRATGKENYNETRLMNKWSCGLGGHIDKEDEQEPITRAMIRELKEEVKIAEYPTPKIIGYINDDSNDVGKVHFGLVAIAETTHNVEKNDSEMAEGSFYSIDELEKKFQNPENDIESWTQLSWPSIKKYLTSL